jgi:AraC family transcriptional regulator
VVSLKFMDGLMEYVDLRINSCGYSDHPQGWTEKKRHPDYDLWYVTSGEVTMEYYGGEDVATEGDILFFHPDVPYLAACSSAPCSHIFIHFDFPLGQRFNFLDEFNLMGVIPHRRFAKEGPLFRSGFEAYRAKEPMTALMLKGHLLVLLARLLAMPREMASDGRESLQQTKHFTKLKPVLHYIEEHIDDNIPAELLADMIGLSPKYFYTYFKNNIGLTPQDYMNRMKMSRARELLIERKLTVKEIAYQLGFSDPYTFSKIFKRFHKISPSKFVDQT